MTNQDIAQQRLYNQYIARQTFKSPADIVKYMGAIQAQDYAGAKWALGLRLQNSNDAAIDKAMANGDIIRTHVLRPTWHFVSPNDIRWMLDLTSPRIKGFSSPWLKKIELDDALLKKSNNALANALEGNKQLTRAGVIAVLQQAGIATDNLRMIYLLLWAELEKVICSGGKQGKQHTYSLFDDKVPFTPPKSKDEALAELAKRYFSSRGPATLPDFAWWSGLTTTDAKIGLELIKPSLTSTKVNGLEYWIDKDQSGLAPTPPVAYLLPAYDEFAVAYKDRTAIVNPKYLKEARHVIFDPSIIINSQVVGTWRRTIKSNNIEISLNPFGKLNKGQSNAVEKAANQYLKFMKA